MEYLSKHIPLKPEHIPAELIDTLDTRGGSPFLRINVYYMKGARPRGLKLSITRIIKGDTFDTFFPMSSYNGSLHLETLKRQNNAKGAAWAEKVMRHLGAIETIATTTERPDWQEVFRILEGEAAPAPRPAMPANLASITMHQGA